MTLGEAFRSIRTELGWSQKAAAEHFHTNQSQVSQFERDVVHRPDLCGIVRLVPAEATCREAVRVLASYGARCGLYLVPDAKPGEELPNRVESQTARPYDGVQLRRDASDYLVKSDLVAAYQVLTTIVENEPDREESWFERGWLSSDLGLLDRAVADYSKALEINPNYRRAQGNRGRVFARQGKHAEAIVDFTAGVDQGRSKYVVASFLKLRAKSWAALNLHAEAMDDLTAMLAIRPDSPGGLQFRASCAIELGRFDVAMDDLTKVRGWKSDDPEYWRLRGIAEMHTGKLAAARGSFDKSTALSVEALVASSATAAQAAATAEACSAVLAQGAVSLVQEVLERAEWDFWTLAEQVHGLSGLLADSSDAADPLADGSGPARHAQLLEEFWTLGTAPLKPLDGGPANLADESQANEWLQALKTESAQAWKAYAGPVTAKSRDLSRLLKFHAESGYSRIQGAREAASSRQLIQQEPAAQTTERQQDESGPGIRGDRSADVTIHRAIAAAINPELLALQTTVEAIAAQVAAHDRDSPRANQAELGGERGVNAPYTAVALPLETQSPGPLNAADLDAGHLVESLVTSIRAMRDRLGSLLGPGSMAQGATPAPPLSVALPRTASDKTDMWTAGQVGPQPQHRGVGDEVEGLRVSDRIGATRNWRLRFSPLEKDSEFQFVELLVDFGGSPPRKPLESESSPDLAPNEPNESGNELAMARRWSGRLGLEAWLSADVEPFAWWTDSKERVAATVIAASKAAVAIEWESIPARVSGAHTLRRADLAVRADEESGPGGINWFGITGTVEVAGHSISLLELVRASRAGRRFVALSADEFAEISDDLAAVVERLAAWFSSAHRAVRMPRLAMLAACYGDEEFASLFEQDIVEQTRRANELSVPQTAAQCRLQLSLFQHAGYEWLYRLASWAPGACLADDMGIGKTRQVVALLLARAELGPALVVAPASVCRKWLDFDNSVAGGASGIASETVLRPRTFSKSGGPAPRVREVYVASYDYVTRNADAIWLTHWSTVIFDEGHALKNRHAIRTRNLAKIKGDFKVIVSGTPLENDLAELWSVAQFFAPGLLGSEREFETRFRRPIESGDGARADLLFDLLSPFVLRRLQDDVTDPALKLKGLTVLLETVTLSPFERDHYEARRQLAEREIRNMLASVTEARKGFHAIDLLRQLRSIAVGIDRPLGFEGPGAKIRRLSQMVREDKAAGRQVLVFSQWTSALGLVAEALAESGIDCQTLDGSLSAAMRTQRCSRFQAGETDVLLLSLGAGGVGIDLFRASRVYLLDPWWNPHKEMQAICRAYRRGNDQPVVAIRIIAKDTVEEGVVRLQERKQQLFDQVVNGGRSVTPTVDEILSLLE